ncbi:MAG: DUF1848 domain-containing protein [Zoogloeaceae bacterium]|nr:DUF1848 domain-containing protein [Zoogloeaceae bacterium]
MIISASRRTDIPKFYSGWFMNCIRAGYATPRNPFNGKPYRVKMGKGDVIVFWTRDATTLIPDLQELDERGFHYYFQYTLTGYPRKFEPSTPKRDEAIHTFRVLADKIGAKKMIWRYDPIFLTGDIDAAWHKENFSYIASRLQGKSQRVIISFVDFYKKFEASFVRMHRVQRLRASGQGLAPEVDALCRHIVSEAGKNGMRVQTCAEGKLEIAGLERGKCIDDELIYDLFGLAYKGKKDKGQRKTCDCVESRDVGEDTTCLHGCVYCYATKSHEEAKRKYAGHDPYSPCLVGWPDNADRAALLEKISPDDAKRVRAKPSRETPPDTSPESGADA